MRLTQLLFLVPILLFSCKEDRQKQTVAPQNHTKQHHSQEKQTQQISQSVRLNFFDEKYTSEYIMIVDESTLADHPIQTFLDCKDSYFTIHYIPKKQELRDFWKTDYFENRNLDNIDFEKESAEIEEIIKNNKNDYAIFCYYIPQKFIQSNNGCTIESAYLAENTLANIYYYHNQSQNWQLIKQNKSPYLPRIIEAEFFTENFPSYFEKKKNETNQSSIKDWNGKYKGTFLRLKDESADPRAWGQLNLNIRGNDATLKIDSYVENIVKKLKVKNQTINQITLEEIDSNNTLLLTKKNNNIL